MFTERRLAGGLGTSFWLSSSNMLVTINETEAVGKGGLFYCCSLIEATVRLGTIAARKSGSRSRPCLPPRRTGRWFRLGDEGRGAKLHVSRRADQEVGHVFIIEKIVAIRSALVPEEVAFERPLMIADADDGADVELPQIVQTTDPLRFQFRFCQCRQQHRCQDRHDGDNDQQLDERESGTPAWSPVGKCERWVRIHKV